MIIYFAIYLLYIQLFTIILFIVIVIHLFQILFLESGILFNLIHSNLSQNNYALH